MENLLKNFTQTTVMNNSKHRQEEKHVFFKHVKTKDNVKDLTCHIIAILGLLVKHFKASMLSKILKKDLDDLKTYFREVGLTFEPVTDEYTKQPDFQVKHSGPQGFAVHRNTAKEEAHEE